MRRRFNLRGDTLVDSAGRVLGRLVSLTIDVEEKGGTIGGVEEPGPEQPSLSPDVDDTPNGGGTGEPRRDGPLEVWRHYVEAMKPRSRELDEQTRRIIRDALKVASVEECKRAISACRASAFHMGENDRRRKYNRISQILKGRQGKETTRERIDFFLDVGARLGVQSGVTSADPARVRQAKREVLDAWEFPGDEMVVRRGEESARWLREHGWLVERGDDGRPTFRIAEGG